MYCSVCHIMIFLYIILGHRVHFEMLQFEIIRKKRIRVARKGNKIVWASLNVQGHKGSWYCTLKFNNILNILKCTDINIMNFI